MNRLDCAGRASAISLLAAFVVLLGAHPAEARTRAALHSPVPVPMVRPAAAEDIAIAEPALQDAGITLADPTLSIISEDKFNGTPTPTIVHPGRRIYCVEFARLVSGIALFGDARTWWDQAHKHYAQISDPQPGAVMVFAGRKSMRKGHVAVVKRVISSREVLVDHANWGRDGSIYLNAPVFDVSRSNDWSRVRVWNTRVGALGATTYALKGFIAQRFAVN